mgnify:CR=1 FL=1
MQMLIAALLAVLPKVMFRLSVTTETFLLSWNDAIVTLHWASPRRLTLQVGDVTSPMACLSLWVRLRISARYAPPSTVISPMEPLWRVM